MNTQRGLLCAVQEKLAHLQMHSEKTLNDCWVCCVNTQQDLTHATKDECRGIAMSGGGSLQTRHAGSCTHADFSTQTHLQGHSAHTLKSFPTLQ